MLTAERLREILSYDPESGQWIWLKPTGGRVRAGAPAGRKSGSGYWQIGIDGRRYPSARLAFLYMTGAWPTLPEVDHIDHNPDNGRWSNLREATRSQNSANRPKPRHNTSGAKGVTWAKRERRWVAQIMRDYKRICLGYFATVEEAAEAYRQGAKKHFGDFARS